MDKHYGHKNLVFLVDDTLRDNVRVQKTFFDLRDGELNSGAKQNDQLCKNYQVCYATKPEEVGIALDHCQQKCYLVISSQSWLRETVPFQSKLSEWQNEGPFVIYISSD